MGMIEIASEEQNMSEYSNSNQTLSNTSKLHIYNISKVCDGAFKILLQN